MNEKEFLDLLRYYFRKANPEDVAEILADYEAHFAEARERGLSDEEITKELGRPQDIYESYQAEGIVSEKNKMEKISDNAEYLANRAQKKVQQTWNEVSPRIPDAATATASFISRLFFIVCTIVAVCIFAVTALIIYLLSMHFAPIMNAPPLPGLHPLTLIGLGGTGLFAGLSIYFIGNLGKEFYKDRSQESLPSTQAVSRSPKVSAQVPESQESPAEADSSKGGDEK